VAPEAAAGINATASAAMAEVEAQGQADSEAQMAAEADAILRGREPKRGAIKPGLRLWGGGSFGLGSFSYGEDVESATAPSSRSYNGQPAAGGTGGAELLLGFGPRIALTLGAYPIFWADSRKSSQTSSVTRSNSSEASASFLPLMGGVSFAQPLGPSFSLLFQGGVGVIPSATVRQKIQTVQTFASSLEVTDVDGTTEYGLAPAWRVLAGGEWSLGGAWAFDLGLQMLGANFGSASGSGSVTVTDQSGTKLYGTPTAVTGTPQELNVLSLSLLAGLRYNF
jgi:hypothetical protein